MPLDEHMLAQAIIDYAMKIRTWGPNQATEFYNWLIESEGFRSPDLLEITDERIHELTYDYENYCTGKVFEH